MNRTLATARTAASLTGCSAATGSPLRRLPVSRTLSASSTGGIICSLGLTGHAADLTGLAGMTQLPRKR